ncbi:MAG: hypothetical protein PHY29_11300 [Syntrophales bacterium]|nr:hypothetical protein [Syntrophales bacterium]
MRTKDKKTQHGIIILLIIINDFVHDLATGLWVSTVLTIFLLEKKLSLAPGTPAAISIQETKRFFFWLGAASIVTIAVTGVARFSYYRSEPNRMGTVKNKALIAKHIVLSIILGAGTYLAYCYSFR